MGRGVVMTVRLFFVVFCILPLHIHFYIPYFTLHYLFYFFSPPFHTSSLHISSLHISSFSYFLLYILPPFHTPSEPLALVPLTQGDTAVTLVRWVFAEFSMKVIHKFIFILQPHRSSTISTLPLSQGECPQGEGVCVYSSHII